MKIEHECPQCGAPIILEETDRLLSCNFCRVRLYIQARDYLRYFFPPADNVKDDLLFIPYWRFRGMHFLCRTDRIEQGLLDKTFSAVNHQSIQPSLGLRPQTLKLRFVQPSDKRIFMRPQFSFGESYAATEQKVSEVLFYEDNLMYLPFWRMKINVRGIDLKSYADLVRYANLPKSIQQEWEEAGLYFWAPAFKVPPATFLMLSRQITLLQPNREIDDNLPGSRIYPANLPGQEAVESVKTTLANMSAMKKILFPQLNNISAECMESLLVYYPFTETNTELIQEELRLGIQKNALKLGQNI